MDSPILVYLTSSNVKISRTFLVLLLCRWTGVISHCKVDYAVWIGLSLPMAPVRPLSSCGAFGFLPFQTRRAIGEFLAQS